MKLLVVLLVAVVLPNLSEGREVSRCEMKKSLDGKIKLSTGLEKHREKILSILICEMEQRSGLKTDLVKVLGKRPTLIVKPTLIPIIPEVDATRPELVTPIIDEGAAITKPMELVSETDQERAKRDADSSEENLSLEDLLEELREGEDEGDDDSSEEDRNSNGRHRGRGKRSPGHGKRHRKHRKIEKPKSVGLYGIFQFSDRIHCDSGHNLSKNVCQTNCTDSFTDDDIMDDIECFMKSPNWLSVVKHSLRCSSETSSFFSDECN